MTTSIQINIRHDAGTATVVNVADIDTFTTWPDKQLSRLTLMSGCELDIAYEDLDPNILHALWLLLERRKILKHGGKLGLIPERNLSGDYLLNAEHGR